MSIFDLDNYTDPVSDAIDAIGDAGDLVGGILKTVSPLLGAVPGIGTAFAVAIYAAGAIAAKDRLTDALIGTASAAMPPGLPRIAFDGAIAMAKDVAEGRTVLDSAIGACRQAASKAGGAAATAGFDAGIAFVRGERIDQRAVDQGRAFALETGGQAAAASFDAGVSIAEGKGADQVVIDVARGYVNQMGGAAALTAFDTGIAIGYGKTLQEAGYIGLHTFIRGNNGIEKIVNFVEQVGRAKNLRQALQEVLESSLASEFSAAIGWNVDSDFIENVLSPYVAAIRRDVSLLEVPAGALAKQWNVAEPIVRQAQTLLRGGDGVIDGVMLRKLKEHPEPHPMFDSSERNVSTNDGYARMGRAIIDSGAKWKGRLLSDIRNGRWFTITVDQEDALNKTTLRVRRTYKIDDRWRRHFEIAIYVFEGASTIGDFQKDVWLSLQDGHGGFEAGQEVQFNRTNPFGFTVRELARDKKVLALPKPTPLREVPPFRPTLVLAGRPERVPLQEVSPVRPIVALAGARKPD